MTTKAFDTLRIFLLKEAGITLRDDQEYQMEIRLRPVFTENNCIDIFSLLTKATINRELKQQIVELFTTNETSFFRDIKVFNFFRTDLFPKLIEANQHRKQINILSAASSSGQEAYSLAITFYDNFPEARDWNIVIQGFDIDSQMVQKARDGWYSQIEVNRGMPTRSLFKHFEREGRGFRVKDHLKKMVIFRQGNLMEINKIAGYYNLILCRNVLIYFTDDTQEKVITELAKKLRPSGYFMLGASEIGRRVPKQYLSHNIKGGVVWYQTTN